MSYIKIHTYNYNLKSWDITEFETRDDYKEFITSCFKIPGEYEFDECSKMFNEQSILFNKDGIYPGKRFPSMTKDFLKYWNTEKEKCRSGCIFKHNDKTWYLTRDYYMWLNFLPIFDKEEKKFGFAKVRDAQYHMALYELLAELNYQHAIILKKRQIASSYFHIAKMLNLYWFEEGAVLKIGASLKDYINEKGSWKFLDEYRNFLNAHTAWYRPNEPDKVLSWQQKIKVRTNGRDTYKGLKSVFSGMSFEKDPTNGVGGPVSIFFHEEAGIAPKMDDTYGYMQPAMKSGMVTTGLFIAAGSVGDLSQCGPLRTYMLNPDGNGFFSVETSLIDGKGTIGRTGLFIPEQWSMLPYIDNYGNSLVEQALEALDRYFEQKKRDLEPAAYQLELSQHPRYIDEAFASRKDAIFPIHLISQQIKKVEEKEYPVEYLDLERDEHGKIQAKKSSKIPIREFPISKKTEDKEGVLCVWERPVDKTEWGTYYASIDPVGEGKTTTSESLCSIIVYKNAIEVTRDDGNGNISNYIEGDKIVATWCGRFDNLTKTHQRLEFIIEWYNAWTLVENNISLFIQYMISIRKQRYLVPRDMVLFLKELNSNQSVFADYGWKNTGVLFKAHLVSYGIQFLQEQIDNEFDENGKVKGSTFGIERIPDIMILKEMQAYEHGLNVDRLVAFCSLVAFVAVQQANRGMRKRLEVTDDKLQNSQKMSKLKVNPYRNLGHSSSALGGMNIKRNPFRNLK